LPRLDPRADRSTFLLTPCQVLIYFVPVAQVIRNYPVHILQCERVVSLDDSFRRRPVLKGANHKLQQNARFTNAKSAGFILVKRRRFCMHGKGHINFLARTANLPE
jgi:hypothetical protein